MNKSVSSTSNYDATQRRFWSVLWAYFELTKPRALMMIVITTALSYMIAATEQIDLMHLVVTCIGVMAAASGALAFNQFMERKLDDKMIRTRNRPLPSGRLSPAEALVFGVVAMVAGYTWLWIFVNPATSAATMACGLSYLFLYTPMKARSSFSSIVGAIPGALLPLMGWLAVRDKLEIGAWILFTILFLWQIPHALVISIRHQKDYARVGMRQLPLITHHLTSRRQLMLNTLFLIPISLMPPMFNMTDMVYPVVALVLGIGLFYRAVKYALIYTEDEAKKVFISLSAYLPCLLIAMYLDKPL